eukprot:256721_1
MNEGNQLSNNNLDDAHSFQNVSEDLVKSALEKSLWKSKFGNEKPTVPSDDKTNKPNIRKNEFVGWSMSSALDPSKLAIRERRLLDGYFSDSSDSDTPSTKQEKSESDEEVDLVYPRSVTDINDVSGGSQLGVASSKDINELNFGALTIQEVEPLSSSPSLDAKDAELSSCSQVVALLDAHDFEIGRMIDNPKECSVTIDDIDPGNQDYIPDMLASSHTDIRPK